MTAVVLAMSVALAGACATTMDTPLTDAAITARVKTALLHGAEVAGLLIEVETFGGAVVLSGRVDSPATATQALHVARSVDGVTDVRSRVHVEPAVPVAGIG